MIKSIFMLCILSFLNPVFSSSKEPEKTLENENEISLGKDREQLDELRKDIPEATRVENDNLAFVLKLFDDPKRDPNKIRREFDKTISQARKKKERESKAKRKDFTSIEKEKRTKFVADSKKTRMDFLKDKKDKEEKKSFFEKERDDRKVYFAAEKEKRNVFESDMRSDKKDFDDFIKDKRKEFDDKFRAFKKEQDEQKRKERLEKEKSQKSAASFNPSKQPLSEENQGYLDDFKKIPKASGVALEPKGEE